MENYIPSPPGNIVLRTLKRWWYWILYAIRIDICIKEILEERKKLKELPKRKGEVAVITGGGRGIGLEVVKQLLQCGFQVIVGDFISGEAALKEIKAAGLPARNVEFLPLDLKSFKSVRTFASSILKKSSRIDLLFNNAGIMFAPFEITEDGFESQFQVNYLGHLLLTNILLPRIKETSRQKSLSCRIVNTASLAAHFTQLDVNRIGMCDEVFARNKAYNDSKLAQILHAKYLDWKLTEENCGVRVYSLHPGIIPSKLWDNLWPPIHVIVTSIRKFYRTTEDGANGIIYAALSPELEGLGGLFLNNCKFQNLNPQIEDFVIQKALWEKSTKLTNSAF